MDAAQQYLDINRASWNNRTETHFQSAFYDVPGFVQGACSLKDIERQWLGDIRGKQVLHLQCHFGQDSISLSRLGAQVTGVDLSDKAIDVARQLAAQTQSDTQFICCDVYDLPQHLDQTFDIVMSTYGTLGWLPDMNRWAEVVAHFLKPGGRLVLVEFHPVVWMFDPQFSKIAYDYFNTGPIVETESGTYADPQAPITQTYVMWNHSLSEVVNSVLHHGLELLQLDELDYSPYNCFQHAIETEPGQFKIPHIGHQIPMVYALHARRKA